MPDRKSRPRPPVLVAVDLAILTLRESTFQVLLIERGNEPFRGAFALPGGFLKSVDEDIYDAALRELREETDLDGVGLHIEQLGVYGKPDRDPRGRVISVVYLAIAPGLPEPSAGTDATDAAWTSIDAVTSGRVELAFDHRQILDDAVEKARTRLEHTPLATAFCARTFTITDLRRVYEAVWGVGLDQRNFYRKVQGVPGFLEATGDERQMPKGRPARLFRAGPATTLHPPITRPESPIKHEETEMYEPRVAVILTALETEYQAVRRQLTELRQDRLGSGTHFEIGTVAGSSCQIVIGLTEAGNGPSAVLAERAIQRYTPAVVLFSGVAGGLRSANLGDVVVGSRVYAYHSAAVEDDGAKARPRTWETNHGVTQMAHHVDRERAWVKRLPYDAAVPTVHFGAIAAGEVVQKSQISVEADWIRDHYNDAVAIEMEGAGIAQAGHLNGVPIAVVRGISDRANSAKTAANDISWQPRAAENAAAFAVELAVQLLQPDTEAASAMRGSEASSSSGTGDNTWEGSGIVSNYNNGGTVGVQAHNFSGGTVNMTVGNVADSGQDVGAIVTELRTLLGDHRAAGHIDEDTYGAAVEELEAAEAMVGESDRESRRKLLLALKRFGGLMSDVTVIAAKVALAVGLVQGSL